MAVVHTRNPELRGLLESLYASMRVWPAEERVRRWMDMPREGVETKMLEEARTLRVWQLSPDVYGHLAWHAMCWDSSERETMWHFLPRMLDEIAWEAEFPGTWPKEWGSSGVGIEMLCSNLAEHDWRRWPDVQREAFVDAMIAIWRVSGNGGCGGVAVTGCLLAMGFEVLEVRAVWGRWPEQERAEHLAVIAMDLFAAGGVHEPLDRWKSIWGDFGVPLAKRRQVVNWLREPASVELFTKGFFDAVNEQGRWLFSTAEEYVQLLDGFVLREGEET